jgi:uncharacterized membrane protein YfcA
VEWDAARLALRPRHRLLLGLVGGGSILAVPVLVYVLGQPVKAATTESLLTRSSSSQKTHLPP